MYVVLVEAEAEVVVEVVGRRLADGRAHDLDDPEVERDLGHLVEHPAPERRPRDRRSAAMRRCDDRPFGGHGRHRQPEVQGAVGEIDVQPALDVVWRRRDDQLVERVLVERLLDRVHRIVAHRDPPVDRSAGGLLDRPQRPLQDEPSLVGLGVALRVARVPFGRRRIGHEDASVDRALRRALPDCEQQRGRGGGLVGHHQDSGRLRCHGAAGCRPPPDRRLNGRMPRSG